VIRHDRDGLLVPPRDPDALASAIAAVLGDPSMAARLAAAGRERAAAFDWDVVAGRLEELYRDAVAAGGPPLR
jgi:phosphatidylinositol alpha-mannosyltransferase